MPVSIATDIYIDDLMSLNLKNICLILLALDFFISLNTGYYKKGVLIYDRKLIWDHIIKKSFLSDSLVLFSLSFSYYFESYKFIMLLVFVKLRYFSNHLKKLRDSFNLNFVT